MRELNKAPSSLVRFAEILQKPSLGSRPSGANLTKIYRPIDTAIALGVLFGVLIITNLQRMPNGIDEFLAIRVTVKNIMLLGCFTLLWSQIFYFCGVYNSQRTSSYKDEISRIIKACFVGSFFTLLFALTSISGSFALRTVFFFWLVTTVVTVLVRPSIRTFTGYLTSHQSKFRYAIIVGSGPLALKLYREICTNSQVKYEVLGFIDSVRGIQLKETEARIIGTLDELENILMHHVVDEVFIALPIRSCYAEIQSTIRICEKVGVESKYLSDIFQTSLARPQYERTLQSSMTSMKVAHDDHRIIIKRVIDIVGSSLGLVICLPIMILAAIAIKFTTKGPLFFKQERFGLNKRKFKMYKFRTMVAEAEELQPFFEEKNELVGPVFKIKDDPRVTSVGKFLRIASIDELPQLFNVLLGNMSLVGPRPLPLRDVARFSEAALMRRFSVKPGITCLWQIGGRSNVEFDRWVELDLKYIDEWSLGLDLKILVKTLPAVLKCDGAV